MEFLVVKRDYLFVDHYFEAAAVFSVRASIIFGNLLSTHNSLPSLLTNDFTLNFKWRRQITRSDTA